MNTFIELENTIDNTVELSSICRGEWCRALESKMDELNNELHDYLKSGDINERLHFEAIATKIQKGYRNLSPDIHV